MSFPSYPKYKDSGVEWLGQVPEHWEALSVRRFAESVQTGMTPLADHIDSDSGLGLAWYTPGDFGNSLQLASPSKTLHSNYATSKDAKIFPPYCVLIVCIGATLGKVGFTNSPSSANQQINAVVPNNRVDGHFLAYSLSVKSDVMRFLSNASTIGIMNQEKTKDILLALPPLPEQRAIASFLDRETSKIDALVAEQRKLIELLKEKRQAVISHAVTKGLNPDAPMKDSGIEWLGMVPKHWEVKRLKHLMQLRSGGTPSKTAQEYWNGDVPWASSKDLKTETLEDTIDHITQLALDNDEATLVPVGSVLVVVRGMILLHTFPVVQTLIPTAINQDLKAILPVAALRMEYLPWLLRGSSSETLRRVDEAAHGTKVLRMEAWTSMELPLPPVGEQSKLAKEIANRLDRLDTLTAEADHAIALLQERRTALVSAAVTGKFDVRSIGKPTLRKSVPNEAQLS